MAGIKIPMSRVEYLAKHMESRMEPVILARGWNYYHRGKVGELHLRGGVELTASVRGSIIYEVVLRLDEAEESSCSCPYGEWCKHMAAVLFKAYAAHGRPELLFVRMQKAAGEHIRVKKGAGKTAKKAESPAPTLSPADPPSGWHDYFQSRYHGYTLTHQESVELFQANAVRMLGRAAEGWESPLRELYLLHMYLFLLRRIDVFQRESRSSYLSYFHEASARQVTEESLKKLEEISSGIDAATAAERYPDHWKATADWVRERLLENLSGVTDWLDVYRLLWWKLLDRREDIGRERELLLRLAGADASAHPDKTEFTHRQQDLILLALAHFDIMEGHDETALSRLEGLHTRRAGDLHTVLERLSRNGEWDRLLIWLRWLLPVLPKAKQEDFHRVCGYWSEAARHVVSGREWLDVLRSLLPRSYLYYTDYLMQQGLYRDWVDLQLSIRVSPGSLFSSEVKAVQETNPELLLPLYHQVVDRLIAEKNRSAYQEAVRLLKKLRQCYLQSDGIHRWKIFMRRLSEKYARLRAFQEELQKGKLLS